jgi:hypothetical protein
MSLKHMPRGYVLPRSTTNDASVETPDPAQPKNWPCLPATLSATRKHHFSSCRYKQSSNARADTAVSCLRDKHVYELPVSAEHSVGPQRLVSIQ